MLSRPDSNLQLYAATGDAGSLYPTGAPAGGQTKKRRSLTEGLFGRKGKPPQGVAVTAKPGVDMITSLPLELVEEITAHLPRACILALSLTCRQMRLVAYGPPEIERNISDVFSLDEFLDYLSMTVSSKPDNWTCRECRAIHVLDTSDTPSTPSGRNCPKVHGWATQPAAEGEEPRLIQPWLTTTGVHLRGYHLGHRHVQAILKYNRLGPENLSRDQKSHLQKLMAPYRGVPAFGVLHENNSSHTVHLKVVNGKLNGKLLGKLLGKSVWSNGWKYATVHASDLASLYVCPHMHTFDPYNIGKSRVVLAMEDSALIGAVEAACVVQGVGHAGCCPAAPSTTRRAAPARGPRFAPGTTLAARASPRRPTGGGRSR